MKTDSLLRPATITIKRGNCKKRLRDQDLLEDQVHAKQDLLSHPEISPEKKSRCHKSERTMKEKPVNIPQGEKLNLEQLVHIIEHEITTNSNPQSLKLRKRIQKSMEKYDGNMEELRPFIFFDRMKNYTRNLVATDHKTYALMLLCWNRGKFSPIHDHPCDGCWLKIIQGKIHEVRYQIKDEELVETQNVIASSGVHFMHDSMGLHKVGNPSKKVDAITLHLYSPPFDQCKLWMNCKSAKCSTATSCYYSEYGEKVEY